MLQKTYKKIITESEALVAEAIGTFTLVFIGIGVGAHFHNVQGGYLPIALAQGIAIAVMVAATGPLSGGHLNPAVTAAAYIGGRIGGGLAFLYLLAQLMGAVLGAYCAEMSFSEPILLKYGFSLPVDSVVGWGTPALVEGMGARRAMLVEAILTFFLVFVVYRTTMTSHKSGIASLAIGLTVAMGIMFGGPLTGAAMNPARAFGPAIVTGRWGNHIIYWIGPMVGGIVAGVLCSKLLVKIDAEERC